MKTSDFFYVLPEELIAQTPIEPRNSSRLMVLNKEKMDRYLSNVILFKSLSNQSVRVNDCADV